MLTLSDLERRLQAIAQAPRAEAMAIQRHDLARLRVFVDGFASWPDLADQVSGLLRARRASVLQMATKLRVKPTQVMTAMRNAGVDPDKWDAAKRDEYSVTWFGRHAHPARTAHLRKILAELLPLVHGDLDVLAFVVGAQSSRALRELLEESPLEVSPLIASGLSATRRTSELKHALNIRIIQLAGLAGKLAALEIGQGVGDGTLQYMKFGIVLSIDRDAELRQIAASRVPHLEIAPAGDGNLLSRPFLNVRAELASIGGAFMFDRATTASQAVARLIASDWRFNWIDIDPMGFAETSGIEVARVVSLITDRGILCITNGGFHADRYQTTNRMKAAIAGATRVGSAYQKKLQLDFITQNLIETDTAFRIGQAASHGVLLRPLLLYDGRDGPAGVLRTYFLARRTDSPTTSDEIQHDTRVHTSVPVKGLLRVFDGTSPRRSNAVPLLRYRITPEVLNRPDQLDVLCDAIGRRWQAVHGELS